MLDGMSCKEAAEALEINIKKYSSMSKEDQHGLALSIWRHSPAKVYGFMGLPNSVEIPKELLREKDKEAMDENIANWLSDEYGFCHKGFVLSIDREEQAQSASAMQRNSRRNTTVNTNPCKTK